MKNSVFITLAFIATFSFLACTVKSSADDDEQFEDYAIPNLVPKGRLRSHKEKSFLAGEDTPCWTVTPDGLHLERVKDKPVKRAIDHWKSRRDWNILVERMERSVNSTALSPDVPELLHRETIENSKNVSKVTRRSVSTPTSSAIVKNVYPTILVVMDYLHPEKKDHPWGNYELMNFIKYALAFWNSVNFRLRRIKKPIIQLRIGGIVLAYNNKNVRNMYVKNRLNPKHDTNQVRINKLTYEKLNKLFREEEATTISGGWAKEIPTSSYDFIVLMTGDHVLVTPGRGHTPPRVLWYAFDNAHYSEWKTPCGPYSQSVGDIIFWDDLNFIGITAAVNHLLHVFGTRDEAVTTSTKAVGTWDINWNLYELEESPQCSWDLVTSGLGNAWCMSQPKQVFPPGKRVRTILPGDIITRARRCRNLDFANGLGWAEEGCGLFKCSESNSGAYAERYIGDDLDGTTCARGKECINNKCVTKTWGNEDVEFA